MKKKKDEALRQVRASSLIAIGWGRIGDLLAANPSSEDEITEMVRREYLRLTPKAYSRCGATLWSLLHTLEMDDLIVVQGHEDKFVAQVTGPYEWDGNGLSIDGDDYFHKRLIEVTELCPVRTMARAKLQPALLEDRYKPLMRVGTIATASGLSF